MGKDFFCAWRKPAVLVFFTFLLAAGCRGPVSENFSYTRVSDGERFIKSGDEEKKKGKEGSRVMTVKEHARLLEEAGIREITGEHIDQIEEMVETMPQEVADALDETQISAFLLAAAGKGEYDYENWTWKPDSRQVYSFDLEAFDERKMYTYFLEGISAINEGEFALTQVKEVVSSEEGGQGPKSHRIQFCYDGTEYAYEAAVYYDWFDTGMIDYMNQVLEKEENPKRLYSMGDGYQACIILYCTKEWADHFNHSGIAKIDL